MKWPLIASVLIAGIVAGVGAASAQQLDRLLVPGMTEFTGPPPLHAPGFRSSEIRLTAQLAEDSPEVSRGVVWRVFGSEPGSDGKLPLIASGEGGAGVFELAPGNYLVHAAFGRAGATKRITLSAGEQRHENVILDAGGLKLDAIVSGGMRISPEKLRFSIYEAREDPSEERPLVLPNVSPGTVIGLNAGTYHVVSTFGVVNAVVRSDIRVEAGKLSEATVEHRAAEMTLKLVREAGGEAIADTQWSVLAESGDLIRESVGAFASMVLAEGNYTVIAKNRDRTYQRDFTVEAGRNQDVEVIASD